ncbi:hypothetical protein HDV57DRAFT_43744 [Trichoderma longibrachiatum]
MLMLSAAPPPPRLRFRLSCFCCSRAEPRLSLHQPQSQSVNQTVSRSVGLKRPHASTLRAPCRAIEGQDPPAQHTAELTVRIPPSPAALHSSFQHCVKCTIWPDTRHIKHTLHDGFCASLSRLVPRCRSPSEPRPRQACGLVSIRSSCRWQSSRHMQSIAGELSSALSHGNALAARSHATEEESRRQASRCEPNVLVLVH